jgi:DNA-binding HxlR family transcriptional regulator
MGRPATTALVTAVEAVGDRWSLQLVEALLDRGSTFRELEQTVGGIAPSTLSARLKHLEERGVVLAIPYTRRPLRFRYELSDAGRALAGALHLLAAWGAEQRGGEAPVRHEVCGTPAQARWWCPTCEVPADDVTDLHHL